MAVGYFIIAILGCADGSTQCTPVMTVPTRYESEAACTAAAPDVLMANAKFDFPSLFAECRKAATPAAAEKIERPPHEPVRKA
jgi:hypothetical protein